jgi:hypothetical protein
VVLTQIDEKDVAREITNGKVARGSGQEDLTAVRRSHDPGRAVDVEADVAGLGANRLPRVEAHSDSDRKRPVVTGERSLTADRREERPASARKGVEQAVAGGVDLDPILSAERLAEQATVISQPSLIAVAKLDQQPGRTFDVGKHERDGSCRRAGHTAMLHLKTGPPRLRIVRGPGRALLHSDETDASAPIVTRIRTRPKEAP